VLLSTQRPSTEFDLQKAREKEAALKTRLGGLGSALVAFSGGVDSTYLLATAADVLGEQVAAATSRSETYSAAELEESQRIAEQFGVKQFVLRTSELEIDNFANNPVNRCYYCKKELFQTLGKLAREHGYAHVLYGANADDAYDHRPGHMAADEIGAIGPLMEVGLTKAEIRELSRLRGLPTWDKPALACLASRFPYHQQITVEKLRMVGEAEAFLRTLGIRQVRVRHHDDRIARIEVEPKDVPRLASPETAEAVVRKLKRIGYVYVALDLEGFRSGSMNEPLGLRGGDAETSGERAAADPKRPSEEGPSRRGDS